MMSHEDLNTIKIDSENIEEPYYMELFINDLN